MNKFRKCLRILYVLVISSLMLLAVAFPGLASDGSKHLITIDPVPIIATIAMIFLLFIAIIVLIYLLVRHLSEAKTRVDRLSKIETEETIQLYDELEAAKWAKEVGTDERPRDVLLDSDYTKGTSKIHSNGQNTTEEQRHGPVPERDMPGYDPHAGENAEEMKPLTPLETPPNQQYAPPVNTPPQPAASPMGTQMYSPSPAYPYAQAAPAQPMVYRPDPEVEIIMRDSSEPVVTYTEQMPVVTPVQHKVRAYRRRGRPQIPYTVPVQQASASPDVVTETETTMPRYNMNHLNIGPLGNAGVSATGSQAVTTEPYTVKVSAPAVTGETIPEPVREAPILDSDTFLAEKEANAEAPEVKVIREDADFEVAKVEIDPPRRTANEKIVVRLGDDLVDGKLMRTLDDVLDELDEDVTEIEAPVVPVYESELIFIGSDILSVDDIPIDDVFDDEEGEAKMFVDGKYTNVRYRTSFKSRFIQSEELIQDYYSVVKNVLMSYEGIISSISWSCETFTKDDSVCAKVNIKDKVLLLYLALDPERYNATKYRYVYDKYAKYKNSKVAMMVKIRSDGALKYALELIADMMAELDINGGAVEDVDYRHVYETTEKLISDGLIKILLAETNDASKATETVVKVDVAEIIESVPTAIPVELDGSSVFNFEETVVNEEKAPAEEIEQPVKEEKAPAEEIEQPVKEEKTPAEEIVQPTIDETVHEIIHAAASEVDALLSDEEAIESIELVEDETHISTGKMAEINLDTICEAFNDGEIVTLDALKERHLVSRSAGRVKVLARGIMTKTLTIYADRFSLQAVKMISLAGGHAEQYK